MAKIPSYFSTLFILYTAIAWNLYRITKRRLLKMIVVFVIINIYANFVDNKQHLHEQQKANNIPKVSESAGTVG